MWIVAGRICTWDVGLDDSSTLHTAGLVQQEMADLPVDRQTLDHLMDMVKLGGSHLAMPTGTWGRIDVFNRGGANKRGPEPGGPCFAPRLPDDFRRLEPLGFVNGEADEGGLLEI